MAKRAQGKDRTTSAKRVGQRPEQLKGLALSGGGIRSASFCLGIMQALADQDKLKRFDYLSAVSGGSWIAASMSWFLSQNGRKEPPPNQKQKGRAAAQQAVLRYGLGPEDYPYNTKPKYFSHDTSAHYAEKEMDEWLRGRNLTSWLRGRAKVITPGFGFGLSALISTVLRSVIINLLIAIPVILAAFVALRLWLDDFLPSEFWTCQTTGLFCNLPAYLQAYVWSIGVFVGLAVFYALVSRPVSWVLDKMRSKHGQDYWEERIFHLRGFVTRWMGHLMMLLMGLTVLASLPLVDRLLTDVAYREWLSGVVSLLGGVLAWFSGAMNTKITETKRSLQLDKLMVPLGCALLIYGALFALYIVAGKLAQGGSWPDILTYFLALAIALGLIPNINDNSLHRFYRDRLMTAFLPDPVFQKESPDFSDRFPLSKLQPIPQSVVRAASQSIWQALRRRFIGKDVYSASQVVKEEWRYVNERRKALKRSDTLVSQTETPAKKGSSGFVRLVSSFLHLLVKAQEAPTGNPAAPYLLINATLTTTDSRDRKLRGRGFSHYVLSSNFVGSEATGYQQTNDFMSDRLTLATAMAISGAAVDPNTYITRHRALSLLMALLNIRSGFWAPNPNPNYRPILKRTVPFWFSAIGREMFGMQLNEEKKFVRLSDGGHAENLGIYELIRRRCRFIVAIDAGADPSWNWTDFGRMVEQVWVDFGVHVRIRPHSHTRKSNPMSAFTEVRPSNSDFVPYGVSGRAWLVADIEYPPFRPASPDAGSRSLSRDTQRATELGGAESTHGCLILIKTTIPKGLSNAHVHAYKLTHKDFPDETTIDQFFDEEQFEAYRALGFEIGQKVMKDRELSKLAGWLSTTRTRKSSVRSVKKTRRRSAAAATHAG